MLIDIDQNQMEFLMKISVKMILGTFLLVITALPVLAMENNAQKATLDSLPVLPLEQIAASIDFCSCGEEDCDESTPVLDWKDITAMQSVCRKLHEHFHAPRKEIEINFCGERQPNESVPAFLKRAFDKLCTCKAYPHDNNIVLDLSNNHLGPMTQGDQIEFAKFFRNIDRISFSSRINVLTLSNNNLSQLPDSLLKLNNLEVLCLSSNNLSGDAVAKVCTISSLKELSLADNHLQHLPDSIGALKKLEEISLSHNLLSPQELEKLSPLKSLKCVYLGDISLQAIPETILNLENLEELDLSDNPISIEELSKLKKLQKIKALNLASINPPHLPDVIFAFPHLTELDLSYNPIETSELRKVFSIKTLQRLTLANMDLHTIPDEITSMPRLFGLSVPNNPLPTTELEKICQLRSALTSLDVSGLGLTTLPADISNLRRLKWLKAAHNGFNEDTETKIRSWLPQDCAFITDDQEQDE